MKIRIIIILLYLLSTIIVCALLGKYFLLIERTDYAPAYLELNNSFREPAIEITRECYCDSTIYCVDIFLDSVEQIKSIFAQDYYGRNITETVQSITNRYDATLGINGEYYDLNYSGYIIKNGIIYRRTVLYFGRPILCIWNNGNMTIEYEGKKPPEQLIEEGVVQTYGFGPILVYDGEKIKDNEKKQHYIIKNPRTAIGMIEPLHYVIVVTDGRTKESLGLTIDELSEYMKNKNVSIAYNLDGGGSSTLVYYNEVINFPSSDGEYYEREIRDAIIIR